MSRTTCCMLVAAILGPMPALADPLPRHTPTRQVAQQQLDLGGGLIEAIFGDGSTQPRYRVRQTYSYGEHGAYRELLAPAVDPRYLPQLAAYDGGEKPGTIIIDTPQRFLFLVQPGGRAIRYGIGVGRPGFSWAGVKRVSAKREWPDWRPPEQMLQRRPDLPHYMAGGPDNPLGARALYLGSSLYRIHGSNEPWTIGQAVSSGCIRMRNEDVIDLYDRVSVGTKVIVI
jgi:lipoprotein-anchoring transpeptidase ErfK/SrfK